jgi:hypothetical protein
MLTIVIIAIVVLLVVAQIITVMNCRSAAVYRPMTTAQYDYYHYIRPR